MQGKLNQDGSAVYIKVVIEPEHTVLVNSNSVLGSAGGLHVDFAAEPMAAGITARTECVAAWLHERFTRPST